MGRQARVVQPIDRRWNPWRKLKNNVDRWNSTGGVSSWVGRASSGFDRSKQLLRRILRMKEGNKHKGIPSPPGNGQCITTDGRARTNLRLPYFWWGGLKDWGIDQSFDGGCLPSNDTRPLRVWNISASWTKQCKKEKWKPLQGISPYHPPALLWNTCPICSEDRVHSYKFISRRTIPYSVVSSSSATWVLTCEISGKIDRLTEVVF